MSVSKIGTRTCTWHITFAVNFSVKGNIRDVDVVIACCHPPICMTERQHNACEILVSKKFLELG